MCVCFLTVFFFEEIIVFADPPFFCIFCYVSRVNLGADLYEDVWYGKKGFEGKASFFSPHSRIIGVSRLSCCLINFNANRFVYVVLVKILSSEGSSFESVHVSKVGPCKAV